MAVGFPELRAVAAAHTRMLDLYFWLRDANALENALHDTDMRGSADKAFINCFVEADVKKWWTIGFGLELSIREESALVEASVVMQSPRGGDSLQDTLRETSIEVKTQPELE